MAEFVQLRKEKWTEPLTLMTQLDLLNEKEFKILTTSLDKNEYKIQSQSRKLEDVLEYIQFESNLLRLIQERRKQLNLYDFSDEIDRFIYNEIRAQFGSAELNFAHSIEFWNSKLRFIATVVPDEDKENEFNALFKKALNYCGRANLEIYRNCVDYLWSFANKPPLRRKRKASYHRDISKLMDNIRNITTTAVRNFPNTPEASIWVLMTELKYLQLLREEEEIYEENPKVPIRYSIPDEIEKSDKLVSVLYKDLVKQHSSKPATFIQLYDAIRLLPVSEARQLTKKTYDQIISIQDKTPEVLSWLIGRSIDENKIDEFLERIKLTMSSSGSKVKLLHICLENLNCFLEKLEFTRDPEECLPLLLEFYTNLVDGDNSEWKLVSSEVLQRNRVEIVKKLPLLLQRLPENCDDKILAHLRDFERRHNLDQMVKDFVKIFPSSFTLVKERVRCILLDEDESKLKPAVIRKYLSGVDWKNCDKEEGMKLIKFVYLQSLIKRKFSKENKMEMLLKLSVPGMDEIRLLHLKSMYIRGVADGRKFYTTFRLLTSDWKFACEAVQIETTICRKCKTLSQVLEYAYQDAVKNGGTNSADPWKVCIKSLYELKREKDSSAMLERALKQFSSNHNRTNGTNGINFHEELLVFSKKFAASQ